ncbi:MAG: apolipoprotein N-acyltransferase [Nitrospiria bacterium]
MKKISLFISAMFKKALQLDTLLAVFTGTSLIFIFPKWDQEALAWVAFIPLLLSLEKKFPARAFYLGWVAGVVFFFGSLNWIITTIVTYGQISWITGFFAFSLMVIILSLYFGAFAWGIAYCSNILHFPKTIYIPTLWTALEFIRGHFFIPFPWVSLGYSQYLHLPLIQISDLTSVYGISFLIMLVNTVLFEIIAVFYFHGKEASPSSRFSWLPLACTLFVFLLVLSYGYIRLIPPDVPAKSVKISVVQGNIDQNKKWDEKFRNKTLSYYEDLSREADKNHPDMIIWPETSVPFLFEQELKYQTELKRFVKDLRTPLLFGSPSVTRSSRGEEWFNSAYLLNSDGNRVDRYDKMNLVPFGEYVPFQSLLFFVNKITEGIGDFRSGERHTVFQLPNHPFGTLICFEVIFPELFRQFVNKGAVFMTTITNDAWFGRSSAPYQHFSMVVFRAIENRTPIARAANTGISGFIDSRGKIEEMTPLFVSAQLTYELKYYGERTFYTRHGDIFGWGILTTGLLIIGYTCWKRKKS